MSSITCPSCHDTIPVEGKWVHFCRVVEGRRRVVSREHHGYFDGRLIEIRAFSATSALECEREVDAYVTDLLRQTAMEAERGGNPELYPDLDRPVFYSPLTDAAEAIQRQDEALLAAELSTEAPLLIEPVGCENAMNIAVPNLCDCGNPAEWLVHEGDLEYRCCGNCYHYAFVINENRTTGWYADPIDPLPLPTLDDLRPADEKCLIEGIPALVDQAIRTARAELGMSTELQPPPWEVHRLPNQNLQIRVGGMSVFCGAVETARALHAALDAVFAPDIMSAYRTAYGWAKAELEERTIADRAATVARLNELAVA